MLTNLIRIITRSLLRHKGFLLVNVVGLSVGIGSCLLILLLLRYELNYDSHHPNSERIYRLTWDEVTRGTSRSLLTPSVTLERLRSWAPEVEASTAIQQWSHVNVRRGSLSYDEEQFFLADPGIFDVFAFTFLKGDPPSALATPNGVVLTASSASRYFGNENPMGRTLDIPRRGGTHVVTGVVEDMPPQSHFHVGILGRLPLADAHVNPWAKPAYIYLKVREGIQASQLESRLAQNAEYEHLGWWVQDLRFMLQPLLSIHLQSHSLQEIEENGDVRYLYIFSAIAAFILLIAGANYVNLTLARSMQRSREVGIRRVLGSSRLQQVVQSLGESLLLGIIVIPCAFVFVDFTLPYINATLQKHIELGGDSLAFLFLWGSVLAVGTGLISGVYPALYLTSVRPADALRNTWLSPLRTVNLRKVLITMQFAAAITLVASTLFVVRQLDFLQTKDLGFRKHNVLVIPLSRSTGPDRHLALKNELLQQAYVEKVSVASGTPMDGAAIVQRIEGNAFQLMMADPDFIPLFGLEMSQGRGLAGDIPSDSDACVINEAAVKALGLENPVGASFEGLGRHRVVGIMKDFHNRTLRMPIEPLVLLNEPKYFRSLLVAIRDGDIPTSVASIAESWKKIFPDQPFQYEFLADSYARQYNAEGRLRDILLGFSGLQLFVACLGLFGLSAFMMQRSTRANGMRKVLGASTGDLVLLHSREFGVMVAVAAILATPSSMMIVSTWLEDFAYRIQADIVIPLLSGSLVLLVALSTVGYHAIIASRANPVDALRYE